MTFFAPLDKPCKVHYYFGDVGGTPDFPKEIEPDKGLRQPAMGGAFPQAARCRKHLLFPNARVF
jgi:hypothetical protein